MGGSRCCSGLRSVFDTLWHARSDTQAAVVCVRSLSAVLLRPSFPPINLLHPCHHGLCHTPDASETTRSLHPTRADVKPGNILLDAQGNGKLGDVGVAMVRTLLPHG